MRLLDCVMQSRSNVRVDLPGCGTFELPGAGVRAEALVSTPLRYVLGDSVRALCIKIATDWPALLRPDNPGLRLPVERLWMEWRRPAVSIVVGSQPQSCGLLVEADAGGRRGRIESFWEDPVHGADRGQVHIEFDLDLPIGRRVDGMRSFAMPAGCDPALAAHARLWVDPGWRDYFSFTSARHLRLDRVIEMCAESVWRDLPMLLAFCRLLAARPEVETVPVERAKLNAARARSGKRPLLDHLELSLKLGEGLAAGSIGAGAGRRADPRLHLVRGHMVNRRGQLFWRSTHMRGRPDRPGAQSKTFTVSLGGPSPVGPG